MQFEKIILRWLHSSEIAAAIGLVGLLLLALGTVGDVTMRWLFNNPIYGLSDLAEIVTPPIVASCFPVALAARHNITIRFLGRALSPRIGQVIELIGQFTAFVIIAGIVWEVARYSWNIYASGQVTWLLGLPAWPSWALTTALLALCVPIQMLVLAEACVNLRDGRPLAGGHPENDEAF